MDYETGTRLDRLEEKVDMVLMKLYPEVVKEQNEQEKEKIIKRKS